MKKGKLLIKVLSVAVVTALTFGIIATLTGCTPPEYNPPEYALTYELAGGENHAENPEVYLSKDLPMVIGAPTKTGYIFMGWTSEINASPQADFEIAKGTKKDLTLTAVWQLNPTLGEGEFGIVYILNGGTNHAENPVKYTAESGTVAINQPTRTGYTFEGWTDQYSSVLKKDYSFVAAENEETIVLTANWSKIKPVEPAGYGEGKLKAPDFSLYSIDDERIKLSDFYGVKPVFVSFWGWDCAPCLEEMKNCFIPVYAEMSGDFELLAPHVRKKDDLLRHLDKNSYDFIILDDANGRVATDCGYATGYIPSNYMVDIWGYLYMDGVSSNKVTDYNVSVMPSVSHMKGVINGAINRAK